MNKKIALYPGSFDPFHLGHLNIIENALEDYDHIVILVANNSGKKHLYSLEKRKEFIENVFSNEFKELKDKVSVEILDKNSRTSKYIYKNKISNVIRGQKTTKNINSMADINLSEDEKQLIFAYLEGNEELKFNFYMTDLDISSSKIKKYITIRRLEEIKDMVPQDILEGIKNESI